jgi:DNA-binding XRE family transcriptional regulator
MNSAWLWDTKITEAKAKRILKDPGSKKFIAIAAVLLSRKNMPKEVFKKYIDPLVFCEHWASIKRRMRQDKWNDSRIIFWQAIYEHLAEKYRKEGIKFRKEVIRITEPLCREAGKKMKEVRKSIGLSQKELAKRAKISQQLISRIEKGGENVSMITLANIAAALNRKVNIDFVV